MKSQQKQITSVITRGGINMRREATLECGHVIDTTEWLYSPEPGRHVEKCKKCEVIQSVNDDLGRAGEFMDRITPVERDLHPRSIEMLEKEFASFRKEIVADMMSRLGSFESAWREKGSQGYQYGQDALEQVKFGWEIAVEKLKKELTNNE